MSSPISMSFLLSQTKANIQFLVSQSTLDISDGDTILLLLSKANILPAFSHSPSSSISSYSSGTSSCPPAVMNPYSPTSTEFYPPRPVHYQAQAVRPYNINGDVPNDLSFDVGELIQVTSEINQEWCSGVTTKDFHAGLFPSSFVSRLSPAPALAPPPPMSTPKQGNGNGTVAQGLMTIPEFPGQETYRNGRSNGHVTASSMPSMPFGGVGRMEDADGYTVYETAPSRSHHAHAGREQS